MTFGQKAFRFHQELQYTGGQLPDGIAIMNPFVDYPYTLPIATQFFQKYFDDDRPRRIILGINPGRLGAGLTGIPFTDPKRLKQECDIDYPGKPAHEPSSVFVYDMIRAYGGAAEFYRDFYINSPCPLGFTAIGKNKKIINHNYYDSAALIEATTPFIIESLVKLINLGIDTDVCFCLGTGKNAKFLQKLNAGHKFFKKIVPLEHPRYIMQYKSRDKEDYIAKYITALRSAASYHKN